jgi:hypothetical protein
MDALFFILLIAFCLGFGSLLIAWGKLIWTGFTRYRQRKHMTRMPDRIRRLNRV